MRKLISLLVMLVPGAGLLASFVKNRPITVSADQTQSGSSCPELEYLKAVSSFSRRGEERSTPCLSL